jgi:hypothetical protein
MISYAYDFRHLETALRRSHPDLDRHAWSESADANAGERRSMEESIAGPVRELYEAVPLLPGLYHFGFPHTVGVAGSSSCASATCGGSRDGSKDHRCPPRVAAGARNDSPARPATAPTSWNLGLQYLNVTAVPTTNNTGRGFPAEYQRCGAADERDEPDDQMQERFFQLHVIWITLLGKIGTYI